MTAERDDYLVKARVKLGLCEDFPLYFDGNNTRAVTQQDFDLLMLAAEAGSDLRRRANIWHASYLEKRRPTKDELDI